MVGDVGPRGIASNLLERDRVGFEGRGQQHLINNRQAGRRRGRGGQQQRPQGTPGRQDTGNRIDNRARGNAAQLLEKYKTLARDSQMQGDRVNTEYYLQFADHYFRVLAETRSRFEDNRRQNGGAAFDEDDQEYDDDGEPVVRAEVRQNGGQGNGNRGESGNRNDAEPRNGNNHGSRNDYRGNDGNRADGPQAADTRLPEDGQYDDDRPRDRGNGSNGYAEVADRYAREDRGSRRSPRAAESAFQHTERDAGSGNSAAPDAESPNASAAEQPRRRGRPRREVEDQQPAPFEADRLPPSLSVSALSDNAEEKPRRRRGRPPASETPPASE